MPFVIGRSSRNSVYAFAAASAAVLIACIAIVRTRPGADLGTWGVTFDLTITIPLLYYWFVVRSGRATAASLLAVFMVCVSAAKIVVPHSPFLHDLRFIAAPLELVVVALIARRMWRREPILPGRIGAFVAAEIAIVTHAIFGWRMRRDVPANATAFSIHERSGWGSIAACILVLITTESIGVHLLLAHWSTKAAWIMTALDFWGMLWILGDYHGLRLRPSLATDDALEVRIGLRWRLAVPWSEIASVEPIASGSFEKKRGVLKAALLDEPRLMIRLRRTLTAHGLAGIQKAVDAIAILPDDEAAFSAALSEYGSRHRCAVRP